MRKGRNQTRQFIQKPMGIIHRETAYPDSNSRPSDAVYVDDIERDKYSFPNGPRKYAILQVLSVRNSPLGQPHKPAASRYAMSVCTPDTALGNPVSLMSCETSYKHVWSASHPLGMGNSTMNGSWVFFTVHFSSRARSRICSQRSGRAELIIGFSNHFFDNLIIIAAD